MDENLKKQLKKIANTIRQLSMDAIEKAGSGHPGLPLGCAELGAYLYGCALDHNPDEPKWINRDRFILSAGHGSMLLYSCLYLAGFDLPLEEIKDFRQLSSATPGHPEYGHTPGVEVTSGPLGQGVGNAVGMALGMKILAQKFNTEEISVIDNKIFCLAGDGCLMEGVSSEACSLAGHMRLNNLILIYDANKICLDGPISECFTEDVKGRFRSYGWDVYEIDGHDFDAMHAVIEEIKENQEKPCVIIAHTVIGKGAPHKEGTHSVHGSPLGEEEVKAAKHDLGLPEEKFYVPQVVLDYFKAKKSLQKMQYEQWKKEFTIWKSKNPELFIIFEKMQTQKVPSDLEKILNEIEMKDPIAGRQASHEVIHKLAEILPYLYGGSADLSSSDKTFIDGNKIISSKDFSGRNIKYGVREFAMGTIVNGLAKTGMILPFCGTFLVFSDYMKNAIRIASITSVQIIYQFTHDSVFLGEDGPTHQPVEQLISLRSIPNLHVLRPADSFEVKMCWLAALNYKGPSALILSRQNLPQLSGTNISYEEGVGRGAYIIHKEKNKPDYTLFATGSELKLALDVAYALEKLDKDVRVVSFPCWELFDMQSVEYQQSIVGDAGIKVSIEAGSSLGWHKYIGKDGIAISIDSFGLSAPPHDLYNAFGFTVESILEQLL